MTLKKSAQPPATGADEVCRQATELVSATPDERRAVNVTVLRGRADVLHCIDMVQSRATREVRSMEGPPYLTMADPTDLSPVERQARRQRERTVAGVQYRVIYDRVAFSQKVAAEHAKRSIKHGEMARTLAGTPLHVLISDDDAAVLQIRTPEPDDVLALLLGPCGLMDTVRACFETLWELAIPLPTGLMTDLDPLDRDILELMSSGVTDDLIARRLEISRRTVVRRAGALQRRLNAHTRFQAGVQAARRGWL
ncbi:helix-turn-helix transcriptional regulator [Luteipulveratus mongoliensis]|uniref:helix-turn-helix transcriptional regulator n=1 Tax=Luteipulveratus mongoliensis TaxID=571913 RepID=UPI000695C413|nr:LuxR C-terminal-related transcriptional regulator [Luteipulveratus mongoliensis]